jgi:hypothetical protein
LIHRTALELPAVSFVFAGPILERSYGSLLESLPNVRALGDVPYSAIPELLTTFDIGWVPHGVEHGQVGGDAIKIYEYRSAGLPVLTTPIIGTVERPMPEVHVRDAPDHANVLRTLIAGRDRVPRVLSDIDPALTWRSKAAFILGELGEAPRDQP